MSGWRNKLLSKQNQVAAGVIIVVLFILILLNAPYEIFVMILVKRYLHSVQ